jgi:hypothetical protein
VGEEMVGSKRIQETEKGSKIKQDEKERRRKEKDGMVQAPIWTQEITRIADRRSASCNP